MDRVSVIRLGRLTYRWALGLMERLAEARRQEAVGDLLLLVEHFPVVTLGRGGGLEDLRVSPVELRRRGVELHETDRGGRATYHGPGQLVVYPILRLSGDLHAYIHRLEQTVIEVLLGYGIRAGRLAEQPGVWVGENKIAAVGVAVHQGVTTHGLALNVDPSLEGFSLIVPCGLTEKGVTSMARELGRQVDLAGVERAFLRAFARVFRVQVESGIRDSPWLLARAPVGDRVEALANLLDGLRLHTVCQEALCPNIAECWGSGTATFMILGDVCTRHCRFCAVTPGRPLPPDPGEPGRVAEAAALLGLRHVVITSVARDDLPDGGAAHFAATIRAVRERCPGASVEVLVPDFGGRLAALRTVLDTRPDVFAHNLETVRRLSPLVQARADYQRSLGLLAWAKDAGLTTKSGLMVGLGETRGEVVAAMGDLRRVGCDVLTLGQYLQPTSRHLPVSEYIPPAEFDWYRQVGEALGFKAVVAGPLVRSSYHAGQIKYPISNPP